MIPFYFFADATLLMLTFLVAKQLFYNRRSRDAHAYPPGPPGHVLVGNILNLPAKKPWVHYADWGKIYGNIMHLEAFSDHLIILSNARVANDILERRSRTYSGRPYPGVGE
ncbi:hypothetical protein MPER_16036, partial [Moniliophthora perniciosa FA553]